MMTWQSRYLPPDILPWQGRNDLPDASCFFQTIRLLPLNQNLPTMVNGFALLGFRCDEGIKRNHGRVGASEGPLAIRQALAKLPLPYNDLVCYDAGDITCLDGDLEAAQLALGEAVALLLKQKLTPIVLGGGHELAWGHYQGIAQNTNKENIAIVNFDAHFDMRPLLVDATGSSGTPFLQIAQLAGDAFSYHCIGIQKTGNIPLLFETAKTHQVEVIYAEDVAQKPVADIQSLLQKTIETNTHLYLSVCLDVFASPYAPGVSAPQALGLTPWQLIPFIRQLASSGKALSYDIAELSPRYDIDQRTAKLAANLIFEILSHHQNKG